MRKLFLLAAAFFFLNGIIAQRTIIYCGQLIDPKNLQVLKESSIIIEGNKIADVVKGYLTPAAGDKLIDLKSKTVMPGLIDMHVHLESETNPNRYMETFTFLPKEP
jgi:imidazolonepropionase-like amidohydrolase